MPSRWRIGTAGWAIPRTSAHAFPAGGPVLSRYAACLGAAEINTSFYRSHRPDTWARWAALTPGDFQFSVKAPRRITHEQRLKDVEALLPPFFAEIEALGDKLGPVLIQTPGRLAFDRDVAGRFVEAWRAAFAGPTVFEPRHPSWFEPVADDLLAQARISRAWADPAPDPRAAEPGGWPGLRYVRWHGSPRIYGSSYDDDALAGLARRLAADPAPAWVIFDNTMWGAAAENALRLQAMLASAEPAQAHRSSLVPGSP